MRLVKYIILIFLFTQIVYAQSTNLEFKHFTTADGLVTNWMVNCPIAQDAQGFIWIGSDHGLHKYNGYNFTVYTNHENDTTSLSNNSIVSIYNDKKRRLWIGTEGGLDRWIPEKESFKRFINTSSPDSGKSIINIAGELKTGKLVGWDNGVLVFDPETGISKLQKQVTEKINTLGAQEAYLDKNDILWVTTPGGLLKYNFDTAELKLFNVNDTKSNNHNSNHINGFITEDLAGRLILGAENTLYYFDRKTETLENLLKPKNGEFSFWSAKNDIIEKISKAGNVINIYQPPLTKEYWIITELNGLNRFDSTGKFISHYSGNYRGIFEDKSGVLWLSTFSNGIYKAVLNPDIFKPVTYGYKELSSLKGEHVLSIIEDNADNLWIGTFNHGLFKFNLKTKTIKNYNQFNTARGLGERMVDCLFMDSKNRIWTGTLNGLSLYHPESDLFTTYYTSPESRGRGNENFFVYANEDSQGNLVFGTYTNGKSKYYSFHFNQQTGKAVFIYKPDFNPTLALKNNGGKVKVFPPKDFKNFPNLTIHSSFEDKNGIVWLGTSEGLLKYNPISRKYKLFTTKDGLPVNTIGGILEDDDGYLWIANSAGLLKLNPDDDSFIQFGKEDGLTNNLFEEYKAACKTKSGLMFFGGFNGVTVIDPGRFKANTVKPVVQITGIKIFGESVPVTRDGILNKSVSLTKQIELGYNQNDITIEYVGLQYKNPEKNKYAYKLEPYEKEWKYVGDIRNAHYTNLSAGKYTFYIKASNSDGVWNEKGKQLSIIINPPPWATWWAYSLYVLFGFGLLYSIRKYELNRRKEKENKRLLQLENERKTKELEQAKEIEKAYAELKSTQVQLIHSEKMASLGELTAGIAHEIKNPLNFVNNFSEVSRELLNEMKTELQNKNEKEVSELIEDLNQNLEKINQHGKRADSIVKGMLLHSRGTSGEKSLTDINDLLDQYVNLAYHGMRAQNKEFNITIEKDFDENLEKINVVPQDISRVFLNIINNACYAAYDKKKKCSENNFSPTLRVTTKNLDGKIEIRIGDNGNGIPPDIIDKIFQPFFTTKPTGEGTGLGLSLSYDIVTKMHGGKLKVETKAGEGTYFVILLPKH